jgi:hypothetical protein
MALPTSTLAEAVVVSAGVAGLTTTLSPPSPHLPAVGTLFPSPE